jgi:hypothetical protein
MRTGFGLVPCVPHLCEEEAACAIAAHVEVVAQALAPRCGRKALLCEVACGVIAYQNSAAVRLQYLFEMLYCLRRSHAWDTSDTSDMHQQLEFGIVQASRISRMHGDIEIGTELQQTLVRCTGHMYWCTHLADARPRIGRQCKDTGDDVNRTLCNMLRQSVAGNVGHKRCHARRVESFGLLQDAHCVERIVAAVHGRCGVCCCQRQRGIARAAAGLRAHRS